MCGAPPCGVPDQTRRSRLVLEDVDRGDRMSAAFTTTLPLRLNELIEVGVDCDVPDGEEAKRLTIRHTPGNSLILVIQYREIVGAKRCFGSEAQPFDELTFAA